MYNAPPPNLMQGIQLVENRQNAEALPYLRYAVQHERVTAESWLWLAAATDDLEEYRYGVEQALLLDPYHPVANRMRQDLDRHDLGMVSAYPGAELERRRDDTAARHRPSRIRRTLRAVVVLVLIGGCVGGAAALIVSGVLRALVDEWLQDDNTYTLEFTVGSQPGYRFQVTVPESWLPADTDSPSWRDRRDALEAAFPAQSSLWEQIGVPFSRAVRDPTYDDMLPPIRLVETDADRLQTAGLIPALTLQKVTRFLGANETPDVCAKMRQLEQNIKTSGGLAAQPGRSIIDSGVTTRQDDCVYIIHYRYTNQTQPPYPLDPTVSATREIMVAVAVGDDFYATWEITLADAAYDEYADAIQRMIDTLAYRSP